MPRFLGNGLLLAGTLALCLVVAEGAARLTDNLPLFDLTLPLGQGGLGVDTTAQRLDEVPRPASVSREWFFTDPPPLPNRHAVPQEWIELERTLEEKTDTYRREFKSWDIFKAWNAAFVGDPCASDFFAEAPGWLFVYDPPGGEKRPIYRYLANTTTPRGLVTNQFGWRGPPVPFARSPKTIRIVFVGASTTVGGHAIPYSYPEFIGHWLNMWAAAHRPDIRFEVMNAGREAVSSSDIEAIIRQEVAPTRPDLVVYYEGANQFWLGDVVRNMPKVERPSVELPPDSIAARLLTGGSRHFDLVRRVKALVATAELPPGGGEWPKPTYEFVWPHGVDEFDPDLVSPELPSNLSTIVHDLDRIRADLAQVDSEFALSSFMWLVKDGMALHPIRNRMLWEYLNIYDFPYRYRDIARMAAFQNRVFAKYAATRGIPFIDYAGHMPFDPDLFADAIHNTYPGMRLQAWVVLQQLMPIIEKRLASGAWPKPVPVMPDTHPAFETPPRKITVACKPR